MFGVFTMTRNSGKIHQSLTHAGNKHGFIIYYLQHFAPVKLYYWPFRNQGKLSHKVLTNNTLCTCSLILLCGLRFFCKHLSIFVRFLDSCGRLTIPEHFIPFGLGERRCPGEALVDMEVYLFFTHIMHQLNVRAEGTILNLESDYRLAIQPKPFKIRISSREDWSIFDRQ